MERKEYIAVGAAHLREERERESANQKKKRGEIGLGKTAQPEGERRSSGREK